MHFSLPIEGFARATTGRDSKRNINGSISCDKKVLDKCGATLMVFGKRDVFLPVNYEEMVPHCESEYEAEDCIKSYSRKCLNSFERQLLGMLCLGAGQVLRKRCSSMGTQEYLSHYRCIKKVIPSLHDAMDQLINSLVTINDQKHQDPPLEQSCCSFARYTEYSTRIVKYGCQTFDPTAEQYIAVQMIKGYSAEVLELACPGFEFNSEKCRKVQLPTGKYLKC